MAFWISWAIATAMALGFLAFFFIGLGDGSVSSFNIGLWAAILLALGVIVLGSLWLRSNGHPGAGLLLALIGAMPGAFMGLWVLAMMLGPGRWN